MSNYKLSPSSNAFGSSKKGVTFGSLSEKRTSKSRRKDMKDVAANQFRAPLPASLTLSEAAAIMRRENVSGELRRLAAATLGRKGGSLSHGGGRPKRQPE